MLELIFRGFLEWVYVLLVEMWGFIADGLLGIMGLDFDYLQTHVPIIGQMEQIIMAAGWALLLGNLIFQALKSMAAGLGFEGEDPKLLFSRTFVFAFLLLASPQICRIGLNLTSNIMELLSVPDAVDVKLVDESVFGALSAAWIMAIICSIIVMFKVLGLVIEIAERYVILAMLAITAPLAFSMGGSKNTASIFSGWCRMFGSMCLLMVTNLVCFKMLFSILSTVPSGLDVLPWMVLIFAIVKVAKKSDAIITRIGLNPAITGGSGKSLPGMLAYTIVRTAASQVAKGMGGSGSGGGTSTKAPSPGSARSSSFFARFGGRSMGGGQHSSQSPGSTGGGYTYQNSRQQNVSSQSASQQANSQQSGTNHASPQQNNVRQENMSHASTQQSTGEISAFNSNSRTYAGGGRGQQTRRSSVPPGTRRSSSYVPPPDTTNTPSAPGTSGTAVHQMTGGNSTVNTNSQVNAGGGRGQQTRHSSVPPGARRPSSYVPPSGTTSTPAAPGAAGTATHQLPTSFRPGTSSPKAGTSGASVSHPGAARTTAAPKPRTSDTSIHRPGLAGTAPKGASAGKPNSAQPGMAGTAAHTQSNRSTQNTSHAVGGSMVHSSSQTSAQTNITAGSGTSGTSVTQAPPTMPARPPHPGGPAASQPAPRQGDTRSTRREKPDTKASAPSIPPPGASQPGAAGKPDRSTQRPADSVYRPGRNAPPVNAGPSSSRSGTIQKERTSDISRTQIERTTSSMTTQERASGSSRAAKGGATPGPDRQEQRKAAAPAVPPVKGGVPTVRPGPAGTAPTGKRAASTKRPAEHLSKRAKPIQSPQARNKGGKHRG